MATQTLTINKTDPGDSTVVDMSGNGTIDFVGSFGGTLVDVMTSVDGGTTWSLLSVLKITESFNIIRFGSYKLKLHVRDDVSDSTNFSSTVTN